MLSFQPQYRSDYKSHIGTFIQECKIYRDYSPSKKISLKNIAAMKIPYTPTLKTSIAAHLDVFVDDLLPILKDKSDAADISQKDISIIV